MPNVEPLIHVESAIVALEVELRAMSRTDEQSARLLSLHSRHILSNIANTLNGIRGELSGYLYRNAPLEESPSE